MLSMIIPKIKHLKKLSVSLIMILTMGCGLINDAIPTPVSSNENNSSTTIQTEGKTMNLLVNDENGKDDFKITLSEGNTDYQPPEDLPVVIGEPLTEEEIEEILSRLPDLPQSENLQAEFNTPPEVLPPPRPGDTIEQPFPLEPEEEPAEVEDGPLEVLRYSPEGVIAMAPFISITFNQPMVPLGTLAQLSQEDIPVEIVPAIQGTWRWIGTKTLTFEFDSEDIDRLPMATEYRITVPEGTESINGNELEESVSWSFQTPAPIMKTYHPNDGPQPLEPLIFIGFDQRINQKDVLDTINLTANGEIFDLRLATENEIEEDETVRNLIENHPQERWLAFKTTKELPKDTNINIEIGPGTPSAEGILTTTEKQSFQFQTYPQLRIEEYGCSWYGETCPPLSPFYIRFNNPLDEELFEEAKISVTPEIPAMSISVIGNTITIQGATEGRTTYKITLDADIQDIFGQTLEREEKISITTGKAEPMLIGPQKNFITLDPYSQKPELSLYTINYSKLDVRIYQVEPENWRDYQNYLRDFYQVDSSTEPPGRLLFNQMINLETDEDSLSEVKIDIDSLMEGEFGHYIVVVKPPKGFFEEERPWEWIHVWVQVTQIGIDAFVDHSSLVAWVTDLKTGDSLKNIEIQTFDGDVKKSSDTYGIAEFDLPADGIFGLMAIDGEDIALLPANYGYWSEGGWMPREVSDSLRWYVIDDRAMYKPGEEIHLKGFIRKIGQKQDGDVSLVGKSLEEINYRVYDSQGNEILTETTSVNKNGGFDLSFKIPERVNLGEAYVEFTAPGLSTNESGKNFYHAFQIQEFRRPEFEVVARNETVGPYFAGENAIVAVEAAYYAGGALPNADVTWNVTKTETNYEPPNWPEFTFGIWQPWWFDYRMDFWGYEPPQISQSFSGKTDSTGNHYLQMGFEGDEETRPHSVVAEAVVMDVNRQAWAGSTSLLVHPADIYVGLRSEKYFVEKNEPLNVDLIVTDLDGSPISNQLIEVTAGRIVWKYQKGEWVEVFEDIQTCEISSKEEPVQCSFTTAIGGKYQIKAVVTDDEGRKNYSQIDRWVSGGELPPARNVEQEQITLIPDKESYQPGDTAKILVQSPFYPAEGLLTVSRSGILYTQPFRMEESTYTLEIPIKETQIPNIHVQVDLNGTSPRLDDEGEALEEVPPRPAFASGSLSLEIPPTSRILDVAIDPEKILLSPGEKSSIEVTVKDQGGLPIPDAEVSLIVVDEAILALTQYKLTDPISVFYSQRSSDVFSTYTRANIVLVDPSTLAGDGSLPMATQSLSKSVTDGMTSVEGRGGGAMEEPAMAAPMADMAMEEAEGGESAASSESIAVRTDFNPLAIFSPEEKTNANGQVTVQFRLPDNLTRYRIMVVAADPGGKMFGSNEANITARLPLMVRPSMSRFLNFGDQFQIPIILQNQTDEEMIADVVIEGSNLEITETPGKRFTIPANDRIEVRFAGKSVMAGKAYLQIAAISGSNSDAAQISLPVYTPATTEAFATYGVVENGSIAQPVLSPEDVYPQFGGLEITTSSTALNSLSDAVLYLMDYPFNSSAQMASRILAIAALKDVLSAFNADGLPTPEEMETSIQNDIEGLSKLQNFDGGYPYWSKGYPSIPFHTVHVAHALSRASMMGFEVPDQVIGNLLTYLQNIEQYYPSWYSLKTKQTISAYALYVRMQMNDSDPRKAKALVDDQGLEALSLDAVAWIWQVLLQDSQYESTVQEIRRHVGNQVVETAGAANFFNGYSDDDYVLLHSNRRTDALLLDAMIADNPRSDLIPKIVTGLQANRTKGRWDNTQENVFVLLAMDHYFDTYESQEPEFVAKVWLGDVYAAESEFSGYSTDRYLTTIPMQNLIEIIGDETSKDLILSKDGIGRLYYRLGLKYAPTDLQLEPLDMGFIVQRTYEAVDDPNDVWLDEDGQWHVKAGTRVRVKLNMIADNRRYHVALVDPLPAGLEIINPNLAVSESLPESPSEEGTFFYWWNQWYQHQNMRDSRVEVFTSLLWDGVYEYSYIARATMPGTFIVPPTKAEEMYSPEVFGRGQSDIVIVE